MNVSETIEALPLRLSFQASYLTSYSPKAARVILNITILFLLSASVHGQVYKDTSKACSKCSKWSIVRPLADTVRPGDFFFKVTADRRYSYPGNDACAFSLTNAGQSDISVKVTEANNGNGDFILKPGESARFGDVFNPKDNTDACYTSELPLMQIHVSITSKSKGTLKISALAYPGAACPPDTFIMKSWTSTILP